jgi:signal transduction histidine kinase
VECKIQDSGIGIPESQRDKLFSKFFRAANATKMEVGGSGLGLFITKNIIEAHGGKIWFTSKENQGSTFTIILPVK